MVKVCILEELYAIGAQIVRLSLLCLESAQVLRLASEATIAGLEVGPLNV